MAQTGQAPTVYQTRHGTGGNCGAVEGWDNNVWNLQKINSDILPNVLIHP